jgi:maleylpyruvate isomerase
MTTNSETRFDAARVLDQINAATEHLLSTATRLTDDDVRAPSRLPGWSRAHVLTHLARNADGGRNLLIWASTGIETPEYPSLTARAEQIEAGRDHSAAQLVADLRGSAAAFAVEYLKMPADAWDRRVRWAAGQERRADRIADSQLTEVLVHHVDLDIGYAPAHWPADFVQDMLYRVVASLAARDNTPAMQLRAEDTGGTYRLGAAQPCPTVHGPAYALLAWLMGRSAGADLAFHGAATLPTPPFLY